MASGNAFLSYRVRGNTGVSSPDSSKRRSVCIYQWASVKSQTLNSANISFSPYSVKDWMEEHLSQMEWENVPEDQNQEDDMIS